VREKEYTAQWRLSVSQHREGQGFRVRGERESAFFAFVYLEIFLKFWIWLRVSVQWEASSTKEIKALENLSVDNNNANKTNSHWHAHMGVLWRSLSSLFSIYHPSQNNRIKI
jgi:hypothetical protein